VTRDVRARDSLIACPGWAAPVGVGDQDEVTGNGLRCDLRRSALDEVLMVQRVRGDEYQSWHVALLSGDVLTLREKWCRIIVGGLLDFSIT
jgi:hypothetical protein